MTNFFCVLNLRQFSRRIYFLITIKSCLNSENNLLNNSYLFFFPIRKIRNTRSRNFLHCQLSLEKYRSYQITRPRVYTNIGWIIVNKLWQLAPKDKARASLLSFSFSIYILLCCVHSVDTNSISLFRERKLNSFCKERIEVVNLKNGDWSETGVSRSVDCDNVRNAWPYDQARTLRFCSSRHIYTL